MNCASPILRCALLQERYVPSEWLGPALGVYENVRENNVEFYQTRVPDGSADFQVPQILVIQAPRNKETGKQLY